MFLEIYLNCLCWPEIIKKFKATTISGAKKLAKAGFDEWYSYLTKRGNNEL
jgi:hypothetical protein